MILVFDLDDTLYEEASFVRSGFKAVSKFLELNYDLKREEVYTEMLHLLMKNGRGKTFNDILLKHRLFSVKLLKKCVSTYRSHNPEISFYPDARECLLRFSHVPIYVLTDGNKVVQSNKIRALSLQNFTKQIILTHQYGLINAKPSTYCFLKICRLENAQPVDVMYIGDNPYKDFVGIKPIGFKTIRLLRGNYKDVRVEEQYEAHINILNLNELDDKLLFNLKRI